MSGSDGVSSTPPHARHRTPPLAEPRRQQMSRLRQRDGRSGSVARCVLRQNSRQPGRRADLTVQLGAISHSQAGRDGLRCGCGTARRARWTWRKTHGRAASVRASSMLLVRLRSHDSDAQPHALLSELRARLDCGRASGAEQSVNHRLNKGPPVAQLRVRRSPCAPIRQLRSFIGVQATLSSVNRRHGLPQAAPRFATRQSRPVPNPELLH
jgi:hypothetical protein